MGAKRGPAELDPPSHAFISCLIMKLLMIVPLIIMIIIVIVGLLLMIMILISDLPKRTIEGPAAGGHGGPCEARG